MRHTGERKQPLTRFVMMRGLDGCIWLYAHEDWKRLEDLLQRLSTGPREHRAFARTALVGAGKVAVDGQGRITITPSLMGHAGLGKEAVLHGQVGRIEVWSPERPIHIRKLATGAVALQSKQDHQNSAGASHRRA